MNPTFPEQHPRSTGHSALREIANERLVGESKRSLRGDRSIGRLQADA